MDFDNIFIMLEDMKEHAKKYKRSDLFYSCTQPLDWKIGFYCVHTEKQWFIRITDLSYSIHNSNASKNLIEKISELFTSEEKEKEEELVNFLIESRELEKLLKLKAFW